MEESLSAELVKNLAAFAQNRGNVYGLLSRCFEREVDAPFAEWVANEFSFESDDGALVALVASMRGDLAGCDEAGLEQLAVVFDRAFFGMGPRTAQRAFPYESVYTSAEGLMMQDAYSQVVSAYRESRLAKNPDFHEPEDHLAVEFAFLHSLCERTVAALGERDAQEAERLLAQQRAFLGEHILTWIDDFASDLRKSAETGFYAHLAMFAAAFAHVDAVALDEVLG